ncbi:MAG: ornithine cyclodeaminase family protein [Alphaproteobacteria bacterium]
MGAPIIVSARQVAAALTRPALVDALHGAFAGAVVAPTRHHHDVPVPGGATLLIMPAWRGADASTDGGYLGVKIVTVYPGNAARHCPTIMGVYLLCDIDTGAPLAVIDGPELTLWRTAAASALASAYLARADASRLVMVGAGALAAHLIEAHAHNHPIREVAIWNRTRARAVELARSLAGKPYKITVADDLEAAVRQADIVSVATLSDRPLIRGAWLSAGMHIDLVGAFRPTLRESDDAVISGGCVYVDTRAGALAEAGDIVQPIQAGAFSASDIAGDLHDLAALGAPGQRDIKPVHDYTKWTVFKSVGHGIEDLAAAALVYERL